MLTRTFATRTRSASPRRRVSPPRAPAPPARGHDGAAAVRQIVHAPRPQAQLTVGAPDDAFEREADQVADRVMRMPDPVVAARSAPVGVQRMCDDCEDEMKSGATRAGATESDAVSELKAKAKPGSTPRAPGGLKARMYALEGGGRSLPASERGFFEPRFARDFADVRVHAGPTAASLAHAVGARAFTLGRSIVFGPGEYAPGTESGRRLLAHELTHVVQQSGSGAGAGRIQRVVDFTAAFSNIGLTQGAGATIGATNFNYRDANFTTDVAITATGDSVAELNQWDVGTLQDLVTHWDRYYWRRQNADRRGRFVEKKYSPVNRRIRDQVNGTASVWYADSTHQLLSGLAPSPVGSRFRVTANLTHSDFPNGPETASGSAQPGMDPSDGVRNIDIQRTGGRFNTWVSAHNATTGAWRHIRFLNWNYMRSLDFTGSGASLAVGGETWQLGRHGPHGAGRAAALTGGTTYNAALNDPTLNPVRRVNGWT